MTHKLHVAFTKPDDTTLTFQVIEQSEGLRATQQSLTLYQNHDGFGIYSLNFPCLDESGIIYLLGRGGNTTAMRKFNSLSDRNAAHLSYCQLLHEAADAKGWDLQIDGDAVEPDVPDESQIVIRLDREDAEELLATNTFGMTFSFIAVLEKIQSQVATQNEKRG